MTLCPHVCAVPEEARRGRYSSLELQAIVSCLTLMLEFELWSSRWTSKRLGSEPSSPALTYAGCLCMRRCVLNIAQNHRNRFYHKPSIARHHANPKPTSQVENNYWHYLELHCHSSMVSSSHIMRGNDTPSFKYHHSPRMSCSNSLSLFRAAHLQDPAWIFSWCQGDRLCSWELLPPWIIII